MNRPNFGRSVLLVAVGAIAGAALAFEIEGGNRPTAPVRESAAPTRGAPDAGTPPSNEISDFPQLD